MKAQRPTVLLTGFGPFPGMPDNASARLVPELAKRARAAFPSSEIHDAVLPTEWHAAPQRLDALVSQHRPNLMLLFGVARSCDGFRIETCAHNACRLTEDAAGRLPVSERLFHDAPSSHDATLPTGAIVARLTELGYPAALSDNAGSYLCNAVLYLALRQASVAGHPCRAGFIHIPAYISRSALTFATALDGALEIVRVCLTTKAVNRCGAGAELA